MNVNEFLSFYQLNFQQFQAILGGNNKNKIDVREGKFYQLPGGGGG